MAMEQRFVSGGFPAPPLPEDFPVRLGRLEDRSGIPLEEFARRWLLPQERATAAAMRRTAHRLRVAGHDGVGLLGVRRRRGDADGQYPALAVPGAGLTARSRD